MLIDLFDPSVGQLEELILVLNPMYNHLIKYVEELLVRMQYNFVNKQEVRMDVEQVTSLLQDKFPTSTRKTQRLIQMLEGQKVHFYHLTKRVAMQEIQALFDLSDASFADHLSPSPLVVSQKGAFLAEHIPYLFLLMDSNEMFEKACALLYEPAITCFTGSDFILKKKIERGGGIVNENNLDIKQIHKIIEMSLFTTAGESTFMAAYDDRGNLDRNRDFDRQKNIDHVNMSKLWQRSEYNNKSELEMAEREPSILPMHTFSAAEDSSVRYIVESDEHSLYEMRFHKINHRGDISACSMKIEDQDMQDDHEPEDDEPVDTMPKKSVKIFSDLIAEEQDEA